LGRRNGGGGAELGLAGAILRPCVGPCLELSWAMIMSCLGHVLGDDWVKLGPFLGHVSNHFCATVLSLLNVVIS